MGVHSKPGGPRKLYTRGGKVISSYKRSIKPSGGKMKSFKMKSFKLPRMRKGRSYRSFRSGPASLIPLVVVAIFLAILLFR